MFYCKTLDCQQKSQREHDAFSTEPTDVSVPQLRQEFASLTYERLLTKADGQVVANKLVQFLIETQIGTEGGVSLNLNNLIEHC